MQAEASGPLKRPRLCHAADIAFPHQQQQQQHPAVLTPALTCSQPALPSPAEAGGGAQAELGSLPWRPDHLLAGARRYLANLTAMHGQCVQLQAETKAAEMAVAIFRWAQGSGAAPVAAGGCRR